MNIQAAFGPGLFLGALFFGTMSDRMGRKYTLLMINLVMIFSAALIFLGIFWKNAWITGVGHFLIATGAMPSFSVVLVVVVELFSDEFRQKTVLLFCTCT